MAPFAKSLPSRTELRGFDPLEPRDPHGKWLRGGSLTEDLGTVRERNPRVHLEVHPTVNASQPTARLSLIRTAEGDRGKGHAEKAMRDLTAVADRHGTTLTLTPEPLAGDRKTSKARLTEFYKRHGFVENKGRNADYSISDSMYRPPSRVPADNLAQSLASLGFAPGLDKSAEGLPTPRVAGFVAKGAPAADRLVGAKSTGYKHTVTIPVKNNPFTLGFSDWTGKLALRQDEADKLDQYLQGGTVEDPDAFAVVLHELIHMAGRKDGDAEAYGDANLSEIEEGFTELGSTQHYSEFARAMGVASRPTSMLARGPDGGPVEDAAGKSKHATVAEIGDRMADPASIATQSSWGHYADYVQMAQSWVEGIANAEAESHPELAGTAQALSAMRARHVQLADEINAVGVADKPKVMANQVMRALGVKPADLAQPEKVPGWVRDNWRAGITSGVEYVISNVKFAPRAPGVPTPAPPAGGRRSYDASRQEGAGDRRVGLAVAGQAGGRGAEQGQRARAAVIRAGTAGSAGRRHDAVEAGGLMRPQPLPPRPPEFRGFFDPSRHPRGEHGKFVDEIDKELKKAEADIGRRRRSKAPEAPKAAAAKVADAVAPVADFHQYSAKFTAAQDQAAQLATQRALLAFSQKRINDALNTPPEKMTPDQMAIASRVMERLTATQVSEHVDRLRDGGVPKPLVDHVHAKLGELRQDMAKEQNADAKQKIITHVAAIVAAVALTLGTMGLAIPAALAAIIAAFPALSQEFIDFKADYTTRRAAAKAAKAAAKGPAGRSLTPLEQIELRREVRTAETPVVSTVHRPFGSPAGPGLFHVKGLQLPAYIQNVAHAFTRTGVPESEAIRRAIGVVQDWAAGRTPNGKGHVHPDVQAAAARAIAEWEAAKAAAHGSK